MRTNPSQQLYVNIKQLTNKMREDTSQSTQNNGDGLMKRQSPSLNTNTPQPKGMEENIKIANIMMMLEDERNGRT
jgi:hypothetical protein